MDHHASELASDRRSLRRRNPARAETDVVSPGLELTPQNTGAHETLRRRGLHVLASVPVLVLVAVALAFGIAFLYGIPGELAAIVLVAGAAAYLVVGTGLGVIYLLRSRRLRRAIDGDQPRARLINPR